MSKDERAEKMTCKMEDEETIYCPGNEEGESKVEWVIATYIPVKIIERVENNNTRQCKYLLFHVPFLLMVCDTLQLHRHPSTTILFNILLDQIKRLQLLSSLCPDQLPPSEVCSAIASALNFQKVPQGFFLAELGRFVEKYSLKLSSFMPYYDAMFRLVLRRESYLTRQTSIDDVERLLRKTIDEVRSKYHNYDIQ